MNDQNLLRGLLLAAIAAAFGIGATRYPIGEFSRAGPGLFPLMVSCLLMVIALAVIVRSRFVKRIPIDFSIKNIVLIIVALCGFAVVSQFLNMVFGIAFMVFVASIAGRPFSWVRSLKITVALVAVAYAFQYFLGLNLPMPGLY
ncbi:MAG: tripartite tricarboxylate transporter TctB family protein [Ottowia sp.]|uniref:tripartite tricarboxylate transporter TctB family protein n=1 Tax=Ottowia sp. TaxID=1898956 RepID=UPI003C78945C